MLPTYNLASKQEDRARGYKKKERVTVLACSNATGVHKLPLAFNGKSKKLLKCPPYQFDTETNAWMDHAIFREWFHSQFIPQVDKHLR